MAVEASRAPTDLRAATQGRFARRGRVGHAEARLYALTSAIRGADRETLGPQLRATVDEAEARAILDDLFGPERPMTVPTSAERPAELRSRLLGLMLVVVAVAVALVIRGNGHATRHEAAHPTTSAPGVQGAASLFGVRATSRGLVMRNAVEGLSADFTRAGASVEVGGLSWRASLRAIGYGTRFTRVAAVAPTGARNRVVFARGPVREWYLNGPNGLEQGFTVTRPPAPRAAGPLTLAIGLPASVEIAMPPGARSATILRGGRQLFQYDSLSAVDARGRSLPVTINVTGDFLLIRIDDGGASYPIRVDPWFRHG